MSGQELSSQRRELIERLLRQKSGQARNRIEPRDRRGKLPLSFAQERLWFLHQLEPDSSTYNVTFTIRFLQAVELDALRRTLGEIVARHEILRTTFSASNDGPIQRIADPSPLPLEVIEVAGLSADARAAQLDRLRARELGRSFDLTSGPLLVATIVTGLDSGALLFLTMHHIVIDGWSTTLLTNELRILYEAFASGRPSPLEPLPIQFADYAAWQREWLQGEVLKQQLEFWRRELADAPTLQLPTDRPHSAAGGSTAAREAILLDPEVLAGLREIGRRAGATLYMTGLAAFSAFLSRYTAQEDIVVGTPVANRGRAETDKLIGFFVNMLVMRARVGPETSFLDLLAHVKAAASGAFAHEAVPFEVIVSELSPARDAGRNPIFQVTFAVTPAVTDADAPFELGLVEGTRARFELEVHVTEQQGGLLISFIYDEALFDRETVVRMLRHFGTLVRNVVADPALSVGRLSLLAGSEREHLTAELNDTHGAYPGNASVAALVERQAAERPGAVAVEWGSATLTYEALNARANQIARHLRRHGVGRGSHVALSVERGPNLIIGVLAVLKAGAAYVPLDPDYPAQRLTFMLEDTAPPVLLGEQKLLGALPPYIGRVIRFDEESAAFDAESSENLPAISNGSDIAYVMYTSGSTGRPKGVSVPHRAITRLVWRSLYAPLTALDVVAQASNASFDASTFEIWGALINGGRLVGVPKDVVLSPVSLAGHLAEHGVTAIFMTTALFNQVARERPDAFHSVRHVMFGGEAVDPRAVAAVLTGGPPARLLHVYGPTENTTFSTWHEVKTVADGATTIPIGRGISNSTVYVLDARLQLVPIGVPGEVFVGGEGLASGYLNQPALTAERFVPSPFGNGERLYRTGDVGRWTADGQIEFIGRTDEQVKIRGFRIEPGEVEALLATHAAIRAAAVLARETTPGVKRLIAYIVGRDTAGLDVADVRAYLKEKLPDYMVPSAIVEVPALPLNANGKLDRQALPMPELSRDGDEPARPQTAIEAEIGRIWAQVLGVPDVGLHDNFFELGGDSILSIQIVARANDAGLKLTVKDLFRHQTVAALAAVAGESRARAVSAESSTGEIRQTPIQRWFFEQALAEPHHFNQSVILQAVRPIDASVVEQALTCVLERHDALRARFSRNGDRWIQTVEPSDGSLPLTSVDLRGSSDEEISAALEAEAGRVQASLSLEGPLMRAVLFNVPSGAQRLLIVVHHLAIDAVSWRILLADFNRWCQAIATGEAPAAGTRTSSSGAWVERLEESVRSESGRAEADVWTRLLAGPTGRVPLDREADRRDNTIGTLAHVSVSLGQEETRALLQDVPRAFRTQINDALLTILARTLSRWTGAPAALIDLEGHGREELFDDIDLSQTVGWFTSLFPVRLEPPDAGWLDALKHVKESLRAVPRKGIGYGVLRYLSDDRSVRDAMASLPSAEIGFNYLGQYDHVLDPAGAWRAASDRIGSPCSPLGRRAHLLDVAGFVSGGCLRLDWMYSDRFHDRETIERLAGECLSGLRALIDCCAAADRRGATPSDFPLVSLSQEAVDQITAQYPDFETILPLSPLQQGLLVHTFRAPEDGAYIEQFSSTIEGRLDVDALRRAWQFVVDRHEQLRAAFVWRDADEPVQVVLRKIALPWEVEDWTGLTADEQSERLDARLAEERKKGFDVSVAPAMRCTLVRLADRTHRFALSFHHILLDGWSVQIVLRDVAEAFQAIRAGSELERSPAPSYRAYLAWLRAQSQEAAEHFWKAALEGFDEPTRLRLPAPDRPSPTFADHWVELPESVSEQLSDAGRRRQLTMGTIVEGAWAMLLARYTSEPDVVFGVTVAGRPPAVGNVADIVSLFINTLPMRLKITEGATLLSLLEQLQARQLGMRDFEYARLADVQRWAGASADALFDTIIAYENYPIRPARDRRDEDIAVRDVRIVEQTHYPITVTVVPGRRLGLRIGFDETRYERATVEQMGRHLARILQLIASDVSMTFADARLLDEGERDAIISCGTGRAVDYARETSIARLVERHAAGQPSAPAVTWGPDVLSYAALNQRANQLAHHLRRLGIRRGAHVAISVERGPNLIVGLLAILKAGAAYVPLDPEYPAQRLAFMLQDTVPPVLLTERKLAGSVPAYDGRVVCLDDDRDAIQSEPDENLADAATGSDVAYVIYTSGSTGRPKGVCVPHRAITRLVWNADYAPLTSSDIVAQASNASFDASTFEIWGALINGAQLVGVPKDIMLSPASLGRHLEEHGVTALFLTTALFNQVARERPDAFAGVRHLMFGGEAVDPRAALAVLNANPPRRLLHVYGPTENTTFSTWFEIQRVAENATTIPIGRAIANSSVFVLDGTLHPAPFGVTGEVFVGGEGLAAGYLNQPALTAERFVPSPFGVGERLYRTGDLGRWTPDGQVEFIGRTDEQVKIRGFRIEPGEIEALLAAHPAVRAAAVLARESVPGVKRLVAYVVGGESGGLDVIDVRAYLKARLPDYMMPSAILEIPALPLNANGKLDRQALPLPDESRVPSTRPPESEAEIALGAIWTEVLRLEHLDVDDNFFDLGGDSILAIQVCSRSTRAGWHVTPRLLFENPSVAGLASVARKLDDGSSSSAAVEATGEIPLLPIQRWFFELDVPDNHHFTQAAMLTVKAGVSSAVIERALSALVTHHDALRTRFSKSDEGWSARIDAPAMNGPLLNRVVLSGDDAVAPAAAIGRAAAALQTSLDLQQGPLVRATLFEGPRQPRLLVVIHHLVVDTVSWRVLLEDLDTACAQGMAGEPIVLPAKTTSLRQWAERLTAHADSPSLEGARAWWRSTASKPVPRLPIDYPGGLAANTASTAAHISVTLSRAETDAIVHAIPRTYRTQINEVLLTALLQAAAPWTLSQSLVVDLEGHGRESLFDDVDVNRTVGWFTTIAPIQLKLPAQGNAGDALLSVKEQLRAVGGGTLNYGLLRYCSSEPALRATLANLRAEIGFNYLGRLEVGSGGLFSQASESAGPTSSPRQRRPHLLDIVGVLRDGQLHFDWIYCPLIHNRSTIDGLAQRYVAALKAIIACSYDEMVERFTPSDFPLARIEQRTIEALSDRYRVQGIEDVYPASPLQQGMVFHSMATPGSSLFITQLDCFFEGDLDSRAMAGAWEAVVARHPVLRTVFAVGASEDIHQVVVRNARLPWIEEDWRSLPAAQQPKRLADWLREDRRRGFDVAHPPLLRITLIKMADDRHHLVATHHHGLLDGWSFPLVFQELLADYRARRSGATVEVSQRRPYRDYIAWLERRDRAAEERYWRETLAGFDEPTVLAVDAAPGLPPGDEETSDEQIVGLQAETTRAIEAFAQRQRLTLNTVVQGAWALLLARYSGRDDVLFGTTVSGRPADLPGVEQMIGLFINGLPTRVRVDPNLRIGEWLQRLQAQHADMRQHEGSSVVEIQGWSDVPRGIRLFDTTYVFENYPEEEGLGARLSDIGLRRAEIVSNTSSGLHLRVVPGPRLALRLVYDRRRFASEDVQRMLAQLSGLVEQFAAGADSTIGSISMVTTAEAAQLPDSAAPIAAVWSGAAHEQFARTAETAGDRAAIVDQDGSRSYRWLNERSSQLARHLVRSGIDRDEVVAIYADRSAALVLAVLGVAKSGGAFMLLDPAYPASRHLECLRATNARAFIQAADGPLPEELREYLESVSLRCRVKLPDDHLLDSYPTESPALRFAADDLAYVAFTSGSEGQPKGVLGRHGPLAQYAHWFARACSFGPDDRAAMLSAIPHDPLLRDIFPTLQLGATLCIPSPALMAMPGRLMDWMQSAGVTSCNLTPALARLVCDGNGTVLPGLRNILIVGEVLSPRDVAVLRSAAPNAACVNLYGSTEAQQALACFVLPAAEALAADARIPIGRGIDGVQLLVLNEALHPAAIGEVGEIWVRTPHLSRGYLNDDDLTRRRFVINPSTNAADDRMYRTGDLGRYLASGDVCFAGRRDRQVKIRGYRIEPGEVEAAILQHEGIREAAVIAAGSERDSRVLVAYVAGTPSPNEVRDFLKRRLPPALVPAHFVVLDRLPRTASGKIDRRSLPEPDRAAAGEYVEPRSPIEQTLAGFWTDVLGKERVGLHDNFFDLGGHSLLAARLAARVRQEFQVELPISAVFENPVLGELALALTRAMLDEDADIAQLLDEVKDLSDERVRAIMDDETGSDAGISMTS